MKSPDELAKKLARQWRNPDKREQRLLSTQSWPIKFAIGKPSSDMLIHNIHRVQNHLNLWRNVNVGIVHWRSTRFRSTEDAVEIPVTWELTTPSEWIEAANSKEISQEYYQLEKIVAAAHSIFHRYLVRQRHLVWKKPFDDIFKATKLAMQLTPGCAKGKPLRAISMAGIDSKFFERNRTLIIQLLDIRFEQSVSDLGLETFLDALDENDHWLLVADLDGGLMPFYQQRIRARELMETALPAQKILIVENEKCLYQLPEIKDTLAILGAGLNLSWMASPFLKEKKLAYWGDIDTWGLVMLDRARRYQPYLTPLLMTEEIFASFRNEKAVLEPHPAKFEVPDGLSETETRLYKQLLMSEKGRLEQEFLPKYIVSQAIINWAESVD